MNEAMYKQRCNFLIQPLARVLCLLLLLSCAMSVPAHELRPAVANILFSGSTLEVNLRLNLEALLADLGADHEDSDDSPNASKYDQLRTLAPAQLREEFEKYKPTFEKNVTLRTDSNEVLDARIVDVLIPETGDSRIARDSELILQVELPDESTRVTWQWDERYGAVILRMAEVVTENSFSQYLTDAKQSDSFSNDSVVTRSVADVALDYLKLGYLHILPKGLDHILFVIGLFLLSPRWSPILWQVSAFTVAHTITLAFGVLGYISIPAHIVEPLIALSISVVCLENLITTKIRAWRLYIVVGFGFLHGLGFAGVLGEIGLPTDTFITALLSFNIGVELGQLSVILLCFLLIGWWFRDKSWYRSRLTSVLSIFLAGVGLVFFFDRISMPVL